MIPLVEPQSTYEEDWHQHKFFVDGQLIATIEFDDIEDERGGLWCETTVWCHVGSIGSEPMVSFQRTNLLTGNSIKSVVTSLADRMDMVMWSDGMKTAVFKTITEYRMSSSDGGWLSPLDPNSKDAPEPYLLKPFIASSGTSLIYGKHGSAKSMLVTRLGLTVATGKPFNGEAPNKVGPVLYVDFEDTPEPHRIRLPAIAKSMGLSMDDLDGLIWHERVTKNLKDARRRLRRLIRDHKMVLVIIDSIGLGRASDVSGSEATIKLFKMFSSLGTPILAIDHLNKEDNKKVAVGNLDWREATPIGSQFTQSSARLGWVLIELPQSTAGIKSSNLFNTKHNHTPQHPPIGLNVKLEWNDKSLLTNVEFITQANQFDAVVTDLMKMTEAQKLLVWHFTQQREDGRVIPMSMTDMKKSGVNYGTISANVTTKHASWWEKIAGSKQYTLSTEGLELAILYSSVFGGVKGEGTDE